MKHTGFTLIELMVVIVIILILLGIGAGVGQWQSRKAEIDLTRTAVKNLDLVLVEMEALGISPLSTWNTANFVTKAKDINSLKGMLGSLPENMFTGSTMKDAWGTVIEFVPAGAADANEPKRPTAYFYSYGPDATKGNANAAVGTTAHTQAVDNIYSYEVN